MKNINVAVDEEVLHQARIYAATRDTTISALVRDFLETLLRRQRAVRSFNLEALNSPEE